MANLVKYQKFSYYDHGCSFSNLSLCDACKASGEEDRKIEPLHTAAARRPITKLLIGQTKMA